MAGIPPVYETSTYYYNSWLHKNVFKIMPAVLWPPFLAITCTIVIMVCLLTACAIDSCCSCENDSNNDYNIELSAPSTRNRNNTVGEQEERSGHAETQV